LRLLARRSYDRRADPRSSDAVGPAAPRDREDRDTSGHRRRRIVEPLKGDDMAYQDLQNRLDRGDVIILDGAVGTGLQNTGVPMHGVAWAAAALQTHPYTVRHLH
jgi:hypothetical protein